MSPKNIDETIKKLLDEYAKWCASVLDKEYKKIQKGKFSTEQDRKDAVEKYNTAKKAYDFLLEIAKEPKKFLYSGKNIIYSQLPDGQSIYNKLGPLVHMPYDRDGKHLLVRLGEKVAYYVSIVQYGKYNPKEVWKYYGKNSFDSAAESILSLNKTVRFWNANNLVAAFKDFVPESVFAVDLYKKER